MSATLGLVLLISAGPCRAGFIAAPLPADTPVLQLPELPSTRGFSVVEPRTGTSIAIATDGNLVRANATTDRLERTGGTFDWEGFSFVPDNPNLFGGIAFDASYSAIPGSFAELFVADQVGNRQSFRFEQSSQRVSIVGTNGATISRLIFGARSIGSFVGPFQVHVVPEPASLICCLTAAVTVLGFRWGRNRGRPGMSSREA